MDYKAQGPFPEECRVAINRVASYELHVSDAYLSMVSMGSGVTVRRALALIWVMM